MENKNYKNDEVNNFLESTPKDIEFFVQHSLDFAYQMISYLKKNKMSQKDFAVLINKEESEISKWLAGDHNLTFRTISKIEAALNKQLIFTREEIIERFIPYYKKGKIEDILTQNYMIESNISDKPKIFPLYAEILPSKVSTSISSSEYVEYVEDVPPETLNKKSVA